MRKTLLCIPILEVKQGKRKIQNFPWVHSWYIAVIRSEHSCRAHSLDHQPIRSLSGPTHLILICRGALCNRGQQQRLHREKESLEALKLQKLKANTISLHFWALNNFQFMNYTKGCVMLLTVNITLFPKVYSRSAAHCSFWRSMDVKRCQTAVVSGLLSPHF